MKHAVYSLAVFLLLAVFPPDGKCMVQGEWELFDTVTFKPKMVSVDRLDRKWFATSDGLWMLDESGWTRYPQSTTGMPLGSGSAMESLADGSLWIGTIYNGAIGYDGTSWRSYHTDNSGIGSNRVNGFALDSGGGMWFATPAGAALLKNGRWTLPGPRNTGLNCAAADRRGRVFFGTTEGALMNDSTGWRQYTPLNSGITGTVHEIVAVPDGRVIFASDGGLCILDGVSWKSVPNSAAKSVCVESGGDIWFSNGYGLYFHDGENTVQISSGTCQPGEIRGMSIDREDHLWLAAAYGVYRYSGRFVQLLQPRKPWPPYPDDMLTFTAGSTLPISWMAHHVDRVTLDYSLDGGKTWVAIISSLNSASGTYDWNIPTGFLPPGYLTATVAIRVSALGDTALSHTVDIRIEAKGFRESMADFTPANSGLASGTVRAMTEDADGVKWFATDRGVSRFDGAVWTTFISANSGIASDDVRDCAADSDGSLWFGTAAGISRYSGGTWETWFPGKPTVRIATGGDAVWAVCADSLDSVYHNPVNSVLYRLKGDSWMPFRTVEGDTLNDFSRFEVDGNGNAWMIRTLRDSDVQSCSQPPDQLIRCDGESWRIFPMEGFSDNHEKIHHFTFDAENRLWGVIWSYGSLVSFDGNSWKRYVGPDGGKQNLQEYLLEFAPDGVLWSASYGTLSVYDGAQWKIWENSRGWPSQQIGSIRDIFIDRSNVKWLITNWGVFRFDNRMVPVEEEKTRPGKFAITGNFPNPFNPSTAISFTLPASGRANLSIYSITGQKVRELISEQLPAGAHTVRWDGEDASGKPVSSGVYFSRLEAGGKTATGKMALVR